MIWNGNSAADGGPAGTGGTGGSVAADALADGQRQPDGTGPLRIASVATMPSGLTGPFPRSGVDWAVVPRVNLLPQEILDERRFGRMQKVLAAVVLTVVALCAAGVTWAQLGTSNARAALELTRTQTRELQSQQARYAEVPKVKAELDAARAAREQALGADILWYRFLTDLAVNTPEGTVLSSVTVTTTGATTAGAAEDPLGTGGLGSVKVSGSADRFTDVAAWLDAAGKVNGLGGSRLQSAAREATTADSSSVSYSGSAVVTTNALSHRYDRKAG